jgi:hypothetical protein
MTNTTGSVYTFNQARKKMEVFESFLKERDIIIEPGSELESFTLNIYDVLYKQLDPKIQNQYEDIRPWIRNILGMNNLIHLILEIKDHPSIEQLLEHLLMLNKGNPLQNVPTSVLDDSSNKIFELLVAAAVMKFTDSIELESPKVGLSRNPDIIFETSNVSWGVACKVMHSKKGKSIFDNIIKGIDQIEKSRADKGIVIINIKNLIDHDKYWSIRNEIDWKAGKSPLFGGYKNHNVAFDHLLIESEEIAQLVSDAIGEEDMINAFQGKKALPAFIFYVSSACGIVMNNNPIPTNMGFLLCKSIKELNTKDAEVLELINHSLQYLT